MFVKFIACLIENVEPLSPPGSSRSYRSRGGRGGPKKRNRSKFELTVIGIADSLNGNVEFGETEHAIKFSRKETSYTAYISQKFGTQTVRVSARWPDRNFRLKISPVLVRNREQRGLLGIQDFEVGEHSFDRDFVVQGNSVDEIRTVIDPTVARRIHRHWKSAHHRIDVIAGGGSITFGGKSTRILTQHQLVKIIDSFSRIHGLMLTNYSGFQTDDVAKLEMIYIENDTAVCMVCGENVGDQGVNCLRCKTRHHEDCWRYVGRCSTYGCRSKRAS